MHLLNVKCKLSQQASTMLVLCCVANSSMSLYDLIFQSDVLSIPIRVNYKSFSISSESSARLLAFRRDFQELNRAKDACNNVEDLLDTMLATSFFDSIPNRVKRFTRLSFRNTERPGPLVVAVAALLRRLSRRVQLFDGIPSGVLPDDNILPYFSHYQIRRRMFRSADDTDGEPPDDEVLRVPEIWRPTVLDLSGLPVNEQKRFSYSAVKLHRRCPMSYALSYLVGVSAPRVEPPREVLAGVVVHKAMEVLVKKVHKRTEKPVNKAEVRQVIVEAANREITRNGGTAENNAKVRARDWHEEVVNVHRHMQLEHESLVRVEQEKLAKAQINSLLQKAEQERILAMTVSEEDVISKLAEREAKLQAQQEALYRKEREELVKLQKERTEAADERVEEKKAEREETVIEKSQEQSEQLKTAEQPPTQPLEQLVQPEAQQAVSKLEQPIPMVEKELDEPLTEGLPITTTVPDDITLKTTEAESMKMEVPTEVAVGEEKAKPMKVEAPMVDKEAEPIDGEEKAKPMKVEAPMEVAVDKEAEPIDGEEMAKPTEVAVGDEKTEPMKVEAPMEVAVEEEKPEPPAVEEKPLLVEVRAPMKSIANVKTEVFIEWKSPNSGIRFYGTIDRVDTDPDGLQTVIDLKNKLGNDPDPFQLYFYALGLWRKTGKLPTGVRFHSVVDTLQHSFPVTEEILLETEQRLESLAQKMSGRRFEASPSQHACKFCPFVSVCPSSMRGNSNATGNFHSTMSEVVLSTQRFKHVIDPSQ